MAGLLSRWDSKLYTAKSKDEFDRRMGQKEFQLPAGAVESEMTADEARKHGIGPATMEQAAEDWCGAKKGADGKFYKRTNPNAKWDWYQVGGRWTGSLNPAYDPEKDPANIETCTTCGGTGKRYDDLGLKMRAEDPAYTCNGCQGEGKRVKWPTSWAKYDGDQAPLSSLDRSKIEAFAVLMDGKWYERGEMGWWGAVSDEKDKDAWKQEFQKLLGGLLGTTWLTVVDCHI
jgi:hypothetical protein